MASSRVPRLLSRLQPKCACSSPAPHRGSIAQNTWIQSASQSHAAVAAEVSPPSGQSSSGSEHSVGQQSAEAKPFEDIPGPKNWPLLGSLPYYIFGHGLTRIYDHQVYIYIKLLFHTLYAF